MKANKTNGKNLGRGAKGKVARVSGGAAPVNPENAIGPRGIESSEAQELLGTIERTAGYVEHAAALAGSLSENLLCADALEMVQARREEIMTGLSAILEVYGRDLRATANIFRRRNAAELKAA